jgi:hypothetical protein
MVEPGHAANVASAIHVNGLMAMGTIEQGAHATSRQS